MQQHCCRPVPRLRWNWSVPSQPWHRSAAVSVHCTKRCIYSLKSAPEDGRICRPKHGTDQFLLNHGTGRQQCQYTVPKAVYTVNKLLLRMGEFVDRNMELINSISNAAPVGSSVGALYQKLYIQLKNCSWGWANLSPETCRADFKKINKRNVVASCWLLTSLC